IGSRPRFNQWHLEISSKLRCGMSARRGTRPMYQARVGGRYASLRKRYLQEYPERWRRLSGTANYESANSGMIDRTRRCRCNKISFAYSITLSRIKIDSLAPLFLQVVR